MRPDDRDLPLALPRSPSLDTPAVSSTNPLATDLSLEPAPFDSNDLRFPINLATALRLADARPLLVASAQASVWIAEAELTRAKVLWVPALNLGFDYIRHDGGGPDFNKGIMTAPSTNFFYAGAGLWGIPWGTISTTDAYFEPLVKRQVLNARHWDIQSAKNDSILRTTDAYFHVHQYRGMYAGALYTVDRGRDLVDRINRLSQELVPKVEVDRARNMLADLEQRAVSAKQRWRVASADLTQVLRLDPRAVVEPMEHDHTQITLIDPARVLDDLMPIALTNRPELASHRAMVEAAEVAIRREKARPLLPNVVLNGFQTPFEMIQGGIFGIGPNSSLNQWRGRFDFSVQPLWQLEGVGIGNLARIKQQRGEQSKAIIEFLQTQDRVAGDVTRAQADVQSAAARVYQADRALRTAIITFNGTFEGLQQTSRFGDVLVLINRPQEAVYALQLLNVAFDEYFTTVAEYNRSQFELFHALGYPASELACLHTPGQVLPVDTARPPYLPPVTNGPPPATR
jgi:outer membrane protein TolC